MRVTGRRLKVGFGRHRHAPRPHVANASGARVSHAVLWGPVRLALGATQMIFALTAIALLLLHGMTAGALGCAAVSTAATVASRLLYHGRSGPHGRKQ